MKIPFPGLLLYSLLVVHAPAQEPTGPRRTGPSGLARFEASFGRGWTVWNGPGGVPFRVFGPGASVLAGGVHDLADGRLAVEKILVEHGDWIGVRNQDLRKHHFAENDSQVILEFQQLPRGVPVSDAILLFLFHKGDGKLACLGSEAVTGLDLDPVPTLTKKQALERYERLTGWNARLGPMHHEPFLEFQRDSLGLFRLCWKVTAEFDSHPEAWSIWVDAKTGTAVHRESQIHYCAPGPGLPNIKGNVKGMASPLPRGVTSSNPEQALPMAGVLISVPNVGSVFTGPNGDFTLPYTGSAPVSATVTLSSGQWWNLLYDYSFTPIQTLKVTLDPAKTNYLLFNPKPPTSPKYLTAQVNGPKFMMDMHDYAKRVVPTMTAIDRKIGIYVNRDSACNAFFSGSRITFYRAKGSCNNTASGSVIAHEYGHGIDAWNGGIGRTPATPSEGVADASSIYLLEDPVVGKDFRTTGGAVRTALNGNIHPLTGTSQQVHRIGQSYMGWTWDLLVAARALYGNTLAKKYCEIAVFKSWQANPRDFHDYILQAYIADDNDSNLLNGTPRIDALWNASQKRHFIRPIFRAIKISHTPLPDVRDGSLGFTIRATIDNQAGTLKTASLYFDDGTGSFKNYPMTKGTANNWSAKVPAVASGKLPRYYFSATNDRNNLVRHPLENGDYLVFSVGTKVSLLKDDFETPSSNFTASNGTSTNGWSRNQPFGRNFDPPSAAGGKHVWGVNRSLYDERFHRYAQTVSLTSRTLNTTGLKGMRLRFRRWLTSYTYSRARIYVNNILVQEINRNGEQSWKTIDLDISAQADNKTAVTIRFDWVHAPSSTRYDYVIGGMTMDDLEVYSLQPVKPGSFTVFGNGCKGSGGIPVLSASTPPVVGKSYDVLLANAKASTAAILLTGASNQKWGFITLPFDLKGLGAPSCLLLASPEFLFPVATGPLGKASTRIALPNEPRLIDARIYQQYLVLDQAANLLGIVSSNGGAGTIGG